MTSDFLFSLEALGNERNIDRETLLQVVEEALLIAARKAVAQSRDMRVTIDRKNGNIKCISKLIVVEKVTNLSDEIALADVKKKFPDTTVQLGEEIDWDVSPRDFGRIAAQTAKQAITQKLRAVEKRNVCSQFEDLENQLVTGEVKRIEREGIIISFNGTDGLLTRDERIPGEKFDPGEMVTALLQEINADRPGPSLLLSRAAPDFVRRLFEREVSEISEGLVEIKGVAREAGYRSKIAVCSKESRVDPSGACIGMHGTRVRTIVRELSGEKVDVIEWSADPRVYIANALKPAKLLSVSIDEVEKVATVMVDQDQLSLAIGKKGQNARLATRLTGWKIDILPQENTEQTPEEAFAAQVEKAKAAFCALDGVDEDIAQTLVNSGYTSLEAIAAPETTVEDLASLPGFDETKAAAVIAAAKAALAQ